MYGIDPRTMQPSLSYCGRGARPLRAQPLSRRGSTIRIREGGGIWRRQSERENLHLYSLIFAYPRLMGEKCLKALRAATGADRKEECRMEPRILRATTGGGSEPPNCRLQMVGAARGQYRGLRNARNDRGAKAIRSDFQSNQTRSNPTKSDQSKEQERGRPKEEKRVWDRFRLESLP